MKDMSKKNKENRQNLRNTIKTTKYMLGLVWKSDKLFMFLKGIMALLNALFPIPYVIIPGLIVNELTGDRNINILILYVSIIIITPVISQIVNIIMNRILMKISMKISLKIETDFYYHVSIMDYELHENPDIMVMKDRTQSTLNSSLRTVDQLSDLISAIISLIAISSIIITLNGFIILLIVTIIYVNSLVTKWLNNKQYLFGRELSKCERRQWGITHMLNVAFYAKELRLFNLNSLLINMFVDRKSNTNKAIIDNTKNMNKASIFYSITNLIQQLSIYVYLVYSVIKKGLPVGSMTIYMAAVSQFTNSLSAVANSYIDLTGDSLAIQELMEFMNIPLRQFETGDKTPIFDKDSIIEFKNVSFKYPGSENYVLKNMNLTIRGDEKLCIVGANGSGKSTFIKLLTRLYWLEEGEILLNGINIYEYNYLKYQKLFAPMFQDFALYSMSLGENILLANKYNQDRLNDVCTKSSLSSMVEKLPKGYDTQITKLIDDTGIDPSGGESQRIAIARAVYHDAQIYLLDEPTAALDPITEYEIYTQFNEMITDKAAILITHRLSAVQLADKIAVFENGNIIEYGTHKQLYENCGTYTEMFSKQAQFYRESKDKEIIENYETG